MMSLHVAGLVLFAALLHATWNALVKSGRDTQFNTVLVAAGSALLAAVALPFMAQPAAPSWPYILASALIHQAYFALLAIAYRKGDISQAYPLMRGVPPMLVALGGAIFIGEVPSSMQMMAIACISGGILSLCIGMRARGALPYALANALVIAAYTLVDGLGGRASGAPVAYNFWMHVLSGLMFAGWSLYRRPQALIAYTREFWHIALIGGVGALAGYSIAVWAMTQAPLAAVSALRETSILFATAIAALFLNERISRKRYVAIAFVAGGVALMRLA